MAEKFKVAYEISGDESGLKKALDNAKRAARDFSNEFNRTVANPLTFDPIIKSLKQTFDQLAQVSRTGNSAFAGIEQSAIDAAGGVASLRQDIEGLRSGFVKFAVGVGLAGAEIKQGIDFEAVFTEVRKTISGTREELDQLAQDLLLLSTRISTPAEGLAQIAKQGGQLNLPANELKGFVELVAQASTALNLLPEETGKAFAELRTIFKLSNDETRLLGDQIVAVGAHAHVSATDLFRLFVTVGNTGRQFGLLRSETLSLSAALLQVGKDPTQVGKTLEHLLTSLQNANLGSREFRKGLNLLGIDAKKFADLVGSDPKKALDDFLTSLEALSPRSRVGVISQLFSKKDSSLINELINQLNEFRRISKLASDPQNFAGSLEKDFEESERNVSKTLERLKNSIFRFAVEGAAPFLPAIRAIANGLNDFTTALGTFAQNFPNLSAFAQITALFFPLAGAFRLLRAGFLLLLPNLAGLGIGAALTGVSLAGLRAVVVGVGKALLALVGGPIGAAIIALTFLGIKFLEVKDNLVEFDGQQTTLSELMSATWNTLTNIFSTSSASIDESFKKINGSSDATSQNIKNNLKGSGNDFWSFANIAKLAIESVIRLFGGVGEAIGNTAAFIAQSFKSIFDKITGLASGAAKDLRSALSFDFSFKNIADVNKQADERVKANLDNFKDSMTRRIGIYGRINQSIQDAKKTVDKKLPDEKRLTGGGKDITGLFTDLTHPPPGRGGRGTINTARDDTKQITQARLQELRDSIAQEQSLLQANRDLDVQKAGDNAAAKLVIEQKFNDASLALKLQLLTAELSVKQQELRAAGDRGDAALILADIKRLEGEIIQVRALSGLEAQKLALTETQAVNDRAQAQRDMVNQVIAKYDELFARMQRFDADAAIISASNLPLERQQELLAQIAQAYGEAGQAAQTSGTSMSQFADQAARNMQTSFADFLFDPFKDGLNGMFLGFANILKRMAAEIIASKIFELLLGTKDKTGNLSGGLISGLANQLFAPPAAANAAAGPGQPAAAASPDVFGGFFAGIGDLFKSGMNSVLSGLSNAGGGLVSFFSGLGGLISSGLSALGGLLSSGGGDIASGIAGIFSAVAGAFLADGGYISGPGTGTSDSIPARLSHGEYVVKAASVRAVGVDFLQAINQLGRPPRRGSHLSFAGGGLVGAGPARAERATGKSGGNVRIINVVDPAMAKDWFESSSGEKVLLNHISRNSRQIRQVLA